MPNDVISSDPPLRLHTLTLSHVGPFDHAEIAFAVEPQTSEPWDETRPTLSRPEPSLVTLLTGQNGTGKSVVLESIRTGFGPQYADNLRTLGRAQVTDPRRLEPFSIQLSLTGTPPFQGNVRVASSEPSPPIGSNNVLAGFPFIIAEATGLMSPAAVLTYWSSSLGDGSFEIKEQGRPDHHSTWINCLSGRVDRANVTSTLVHFDWLRGSARPDQKKRGEILYDAAETLLARFLGRGRLKYIDRERFMPIVEFDGREIPLDHLGTGSAWILERCLSLLGRMHSIADLSGWPMDKLLQLPGILLIDEPEAHLHPRMQRELIPLLRTSFPSLQIIATTHSPFVLASAPQATVYVCRSPEESGQSNVIENVSDGYANLQISEILMSKAFDETQPYSSQIADLLTKLDQAIEDNDGAARNAIEEQLKEKNPTQFGYFDLSKRLRQLHQHTDSGK